MLYLCQHPSQKMLTILSVQDNNISIKHLYQAKVVSSTIKNNDQVQNYTHIQILKTCSDVQGTIKLIIELHFLFQVQLQKYTNKTSIDFIHSNISSNIQDPYLFYLCNLYFILLSWIGRICPVILLSTLEGFPRKFGMFLWGSFSWCFFFYLLIAWGH